TPTLTATHSRATRATLRTRRASSGSLLDQGAHKHSPLHRGRVLGDRKAVQKCRAFTFAASNAFLPPAVAGRSFGTIRQPSPGCPVSLPRPNARIASAILIIATIGLPSGA